MVDRKTKQTGDILSHLRQFEAASCTYHGCLKIRLALKCQLYAWYSLALHHCPPLLFHVGAVLGMQEANIKLDAGRVGYNVGQYTPRDDTRVDADALAPPIKALKL